MTHVRTSPYYPQSNGKIERWPQIAKTGHKSLKGECIRPGAPLSLDDARRLVVGYVEHKSEHTPSGKIYGAVPSKCLQRALDSQVIANALDFRVGVI